MTRSARPPIASASRCSTSSRAGSARASTACACSTCSPAPARSGSRRCRAAPRNVVFVDTGAEARGLIRDHIEAFGAGGVTKLLRRDATALGPAGTMGPVDLVFLDPPYGKGLGEQALVVAAATAAG